MGETIVHTARVIAVGIRIARHIQPVPRPALTIMWRLQQMVHELRDGRLRIADCGLGKSLHFLVAGLQASEREISDLIPSKNSPVEDCRSETYFCGLAGALPKISAMILVSQLVIK